MNRAGGLLGLWAESIDRWEVYSKPEKKRVRVLEVESCRWAHVGWAVGGYLSLRLQNPRCGIPVIITESMLSSVQCQ